MGAFSTAMLDAIKSPDRELYFEMIMVGGSPRFSCPCSFFLELRPQEERLLEEVCPLDRPVRVLDVGCGVGRHLEFLRSRVPQAELWAAERDPELRDYCRQRFGDRIHESLDAPALAGLKFDLVMLLGSNVGLFGEEAEVRQGLQRVFDLLKPGGTLLAESGSFTDRGFDDFEFTIHYGALVDSAFRWAYCTREWLLRALTQIGFETRRVEPSTMNDDYYVCVARRPAEA